jgi:PAS domain S-box-containing protein
VTLDFALLRGALEEIPFGVATTRGGTILYANEALTRIFGLPHGALDGKDVASLFDAEAFHRISVCLQEARVFDGRVRAKAADGRQIDVELHIEWYTSGAAGTGGFVVVRDVSAELGALGRLVDQLGGAIFRVRVDTGALELVSPTIVKLIGLDPAACMTRPVLLTALISSEERERLVFLYRRLARGEIPVASAQVSVRRPDGVRRVVQIRATSRRDASGVVRHIDGVATDAARESDATPAPPVRGDTRAPSKDAVPGAIMELSHELLREGSQHLHALGRELRSFRSILRAHGAALPPAARADLEARVESMAATIAGASALSRGARRALSGTKTLGAPFAELLDSVRAILAPVVGERSLTLDAGDAGSLVIADRIDELGCALAYLGLRAFRFAGSGSLRLVAARSQGAASGIPRAAFGGAGGTEYITIEITGSAPPDLADTPLEISSDMLRAIPRPAEADLAYQAAASLILASGGSIEGDEASFTRARSVVRLRV